MRCRALSVFVFLSAALSAASAQSILSTQASLDDFEGDVILDGQPLQRTSGHAVPLADGSDIVTRLGRAEVRLGGNLWLRVGHNGAVKVLSGNPSDRRVEVLGGSAIVEVSGAAADPAPATIQLNGDTIRLLQPGKYRFDSDPPGLRIYRGRVLTQTQAGTAQIGPSQVVALNGGSIARKTAEGGDALLDLWSDERQSLVGSWSGNTHSIMTDPLLDTGDPAPNAPAAGYTALLSPPVEFNIPYGGPSEVSLYGAFALNPFFLISPGLGYLPHYDVPRAHPMYPGLAYPPGTIRPVYPLRPSVPVGRPIGAIPHSGTRPGGRR